MASRGIAERNALAEHYQSLAGYHAEQLHARLPREVQIEDLASDGMIGLMNAIAVFDPARGVKFETFCQRRVRGAMLDGLREMDWTPRLTRNRQHQVGAVRDRLLQERGCEPTREELAAELGPEAGRLLGDSAVREKRSLAAKIGERDGHVQRLEDVLEDEHATIEAEGRLDRESFERLLAGLDRTERLMMKLLYVDELTMKQTGRAVGLSEPRISQMHASVLARLRAKIQHVP